MRIEFKLKIHFLAFVDIVNLPNDIVFLPCSFKLDNTKHYKHLYMNVYPVNAHILHAHTVYFNTLVGVRKSCLDRCNSLLQVLCFRMSPDAQVDQATASVPVTSSLRAAVNMLGAPTRPCELGETSSDPV